MTAGDPRRRVTVLAKSTVVSVTPVRPGKTYPLSPLDHTVAAHTIHLVFYYRPGPTLKRDGLKDSLADVLAYYPAMTGRLTRGEHGWLIKCNDAGVRVLDAKVDATLEEWLRTATAEEETELMYYEPMGQDPSIWSPYYIQITEFEDESYAIGLSCPHTNADPTCAMFFLKAWADIHRRTCVVIPPFFHPPALRPRPDPHPSHPLFSQLVCLASAGGGAYTSAAFSFTDSAVRACLAEIPAPGGGAGAQTPFAALAGLFWSRIARARREISRSPEEGLVVAVDFRKRMHAPLPHGFYGNAMHFSRLSADPAAEWGRVVEGIAKQVAGMEEEEYWRAVEWAEEWRKGGEEPFVIYGAGGITCVAADHVPTRLAAYDTEGPAHVTLRLGGVAGNGVVVVGPGGGGGEEEGMGRTVTVTLPEELTARICSDEEILRHGPTMMFYDRG